MLPLDKACAYLGIGGEFYFKEKTIFERLTLKGLCEDFLNGLSYNVILINFDNELMD